MFAPDPFLHGYAGLAFTSADGVNWTIHTGLPKGLRSLAFVNNLFIAVGENGAIATSPDGIKWTQQKSGTTNNLFSVA